MQFLSDVYLRCPDCNGTRYREEVLEVKREGSNGRRANIAAVLDMTVTEALAFFAESRELATRLKPLADVGLEYVKLGQPVPTLSGGEAQRLKLAGHLADAAAQAVTTSANGKLFLFGRTDDRTALRGRSQTVAGLREVAGRWALAPGDRAQS